MAVNGFQIFELRAFQPEKLMVHAQEMLADNIKTGAGNEVMHVGDAAGERILDRDHAEPRAALVHGGKDILESVARQAHHIGAGFMGRDMRIRAGFALEGDGLFRHGAIRHYTDLRESAARAFSRSAGVSTPRGTVSTSATSIDMPASSARNCSSFSRFSSGDGGRATKRASASRR